MFRRPLFWVLTILVVATVWKVVESCSCLPDHPQNQYCNADFALIGKPSGLSSNSSDTWYTVKIIELFKASSAAKKALKKGYIFTAPNSAMCGVQLNINQTYVLIGGVYNGQASINLCGFNARWVDLTETQKRGFKSQYRESCKCTVNTCFISDCIKTSNTCIYNSTNSNSLNCYPSHGICSPNRFGTCNWAKPSECKGKNLSPLEKCLAA